MDLEARRRRSFSPSIRKGLLNFRCSESSFVQVLGKAHQESVVLVFWVSGTQKNPKNVKNINTSTPGHQENNTLLGWLEMLESTRVARNATSGKQHTT